MNNRNFFEQSSAPTGVASSALLGISREYALENFRKYRSALESANRCDLEALAMLLIQKRTVDGMNGRKWDAGAHLYFEDAVESMMRAMMPNEKGQARLPGRTAPTETGAIEL